MIRTARASDLLLAAFLISITAMLLVPLPTMLLDFLLVINIAFSLILLLAGLYLPNALALLSFPSILLLTTLFRLGLNVASTRLILSQGEAGDVIRAFGTLLIRGEIIVGIIIFLILTVVNFIVVARGAARVSEVAARFALDALPGKQMGIDADVRAGLLSPTDAQRRREDLRKESQLYGSMDGAMKFVQGDAVAGLFIIAVNILGGIYLGMSAGSSLSEAVDTYTTLTVGDGLVHQIPAILISICAGMVVTRVSSGEGSSLGSDVQAQLFARPGTILFGGALVMAMGLVPGLPPLPFLVVGAALVALGWRQQRGGKNILSQPPHPVSTSIVIADSQSSLLLGLDGSSTEEANILKITLDSGYLYRKYKEDQARCRLWWQQLEADFSSEIGLQLPPLRVVVDTLAPFCNYRISIRGTLVIQETLVPDALLAEVSPHAASEFGLEVLEETEHPADGSIVVWVATSETQRKVLEVAGIATYDHFQYIGLRVAAFLRRVPEEVLSVADVIEIENRLEKRFPGLLSRTLNREYFTPARFTELLQELVREGVGVRDSRQIIEAVATYCSTSGAALVAEGEFDLEEVVSFVRASRRRHVLGPMMSPRRTLRVVTLHETAEALLTDTPAVAPNGTLGIAPEHSEKLLKAFLEVLVPVRRLGAGGVVILVSSDVRARLVAFLRQCSIEVPVVAHQELEPTVQVEPVGAVRV